MTVIILIFAMSVAVFFSGLLAAKALRAAFGAAGFEVK